MFWFSGLGSQDSEGGVVLDRAFPTNLPIHAAATLAQANQVSDKFDNLVKGSTTGLLDQIL